METDRQEVRAEIMREPSSSSSSSRAPLSKYRLYRPALIAAGIGLLATLIGTVAVGRWENSLARADFEGLAEAQAILIQNGINEYVSRLTALRTRFESANEDITRNEYQTFSARLFEAHPGLLRVSWLPRIKRKERGEYEAAAITDGVPAFRIKAYPDGAMAPEGDRVPQRSAHSPLRFSAMLLKVLLARRLVVLVLVAGAAGGGTAIVQITLDERAAVSPMPPVPGPAQPRRPAAVPGRRCSGWSGSRGG